jgi:WD40 repeat protein
VAFSPDGRHFLTTSWDHTVRLWDLATGQLAAPGLRHQGPITAAAFSPDGRTLLTGSGEDVLSGRGSEIWGEARLWDLATGQPIGSPLPHRRPVYHVAFCPDGRTVLTNDASPGIDYRPGILDVGTAWLWELAPLPLKYVGTTRGPVHGGAFSPDGRTLVTGSLNSTAQRWNVVTGEPLGGPLRHPAGVTSIAFSPDGKTVVAGTPGETSSLWDAATGQPVGEPLRHFRVYRVAFSPAGNMVLTAGWSLIENQGQVCLWQVPTGKAVGRPLVHPGHVRTAVFSPDSRTILTGCDDRTARLWDVATGQPVGKPLSHRGEVGVVAFSPDGKTLLTGSADATAQLWDARTGDPIGVPFPHRGEVTALAFSPDGKVGLTGSADATAQLWHLATGQLLTSPLRHQGTVLTVAFSPDGRTILTGSSNGTARLWDAATGQPTGPVLRHQGAVRVAIFSPDGRTILTAGGDGKFHLWRVPAPLDAPAKRLALWAEVITGLRMTPDDVVRLQSSEE